MGAAEHKLSRREVLAAACAGAALPLPHHPELVSGSRASPALPHPDRMLKQVQHDERWTKALALYARAEAGLEAVAHTEEDDLYDRALARHSAALARLLRALAPDLAAVSRKLDLIVRHSVFELTFAEPSLAALQRDVRRFAAGAGAMTVPEWP